MGAVRPDDRAMRFLDADVEELLDVKPPYLQQARVHPRRQHQIPNGALDLCVAEQPSAIMRTLLCH